MTKEPKLGGTYTLSDATMTVYRMGYGAMQLAGPQVWGPPRDVDAAIAVLREAITAGVNHIDTSDLHGAIAHPVHDHCRIRKSVSASQLCLFSHWSLSFLRFKKRCVT